MKHLLAAALLFVASAAQPSQAQRQQPVDRLYVFGDSYSDIGAGYLDGNGPTAVAYFAERLGTKLFPSTIDHPTGKSLDFAVSGAQTGDGEGRHIGDALLSYGMRRQVDDFAALVKTKKISFDPPKTLFFLAGGLNDRHLPTDTTVANLEGEIQTLYEIGARRFRIAVLPSAIPAFSEVAIRLNPSLERIPSELSPKLPGAEILVSHWGLFFDEVIENPKRYGITNTTDPCAGRELFKEDAIPCPHPETYFYYHAGHPSTAAHRAVGRMLYTEFTGRTPDN